ncbi:MAG: DUF1353 domain-containing protein [Hyphomonadaceae bacterium]
MNVTARILAFAGFSLLVCLAGSCATPSNLSYSCDAPAKGKTPAFICKGRAEAYFPIDEKGRARDALGSCSELNKNFVPSTDLDVTILSFTEYYDQDRIYAALNSPFDISVDVMCDNKSKRVYVRVPQHYMTDFTSVPLGLPQAFIRTLSKHIYPALAHDFLYAVAPARTGDKDKPEGDPESWYDRSLADDVIRNGVAANGSRDITQATIFITTRLGGSASFAAKSELKLFVKDGESSNDGLTQRRVVSPVESWDQADGQKWMRESYVKICNWPEP